MTDLWSWCAIYEDGTALKEYDDDGTEHGFGEVDKQKTVLFCLTSPDQSRSSYTVQLTRLNAEPVFFRRRSIEVKSDGTEEGRTTIHCIGWKNDETASYLFVFENGHTLLTDDLNAV